MSEKHVNPPAHLGAPGSRCHHPGARRPGRRQQDAARHVPGGAARGVSEARGHQLRFLLRDQAEAHALGPPNPFAYSDETGHFNFCSQANANGQCTGYEGAGKYRQPADSGDSGCQATNPAVFPYQGCGGSDYGLDGTSFIPDWPDGKPNHPTPWTFSSPVTGRHYTTNYQRVAFQDVLPLNESASGSEPHCSQYIRVPGGCTEIPLTDEGKPAAFYPFFSTTKINGCSWVEGNDIPGVTVNDFGKQRQYGGHVNGYCYTVLGGKGLQYNPDFRLILNYNPCPAPVP